MEGGNAQTRTARIRELADMNLAGVAAGAEGPRLPWAYCKILIGYLDAAYAENKRLEAELLEMQTAQAKAVDQLGAL